MAVDFGSKVGLPTSALVQALLLVQFIAFPSALVFGRLGDRIGAVGESIDSVHAFAVEVQADPRLTGELRTAALIVVGEVHASYASAEAAR
jgi:hypothetical protein